MRGNTLRGKKVPLIEENKEVMVEEIRKISKAVKTLANSKLTRDTIEVLIQHKCRVSRTNIRKVLDAALNMEDYFLKPELEEPTKKQRINS